jgi:hypothetical protein
VTVEQLELAISTVPAVETSDPDISIDQMVQIIRNYGRGHHGDAILRQQCQVRLHSAVD